MQVKGPLQRTTLHVTERKTSSCTQGESCGKLAVSSFACQRHSLQLLNRPGGLQAAIWEQAGFLCVAEV